jgi:asparagine synthase (glutamine-hydrolysing)
VCGIIGILHKDHASAPRTVDAVLPVVAAMQDELARRGPDDRGHVQMGACWLAHTRLSIIDLSTGHQPVFNEDGSVAVVFNGEIYNYRELRAELVSRGHTLRTSSDTEVLVHLYEDLGEAFLSRLNGMFALALYDSRRGRLIAARDRLGEKPLLYHDSPWLTVVGSEVKALLRHPEIPREIDREALALYLSSMYVPAPYSIFKGIRKLPPAHYLKVENGALTIHRYWDPALSAVRGRSEAEICDGFVELFSEAVRMRMVADVPLGVFLSGGIDSSAVTAFMSDGTSRVKTFTVGFGDEIDERPYARMVADRYETEHTEIFIKQDIPAAIEEILPYMDEPFGDSSIVPTYLVSKEARKHVKVILTGDGGDELFAGYPSYIDQKYQRGGRIETKLFRTAREALRFGAARRVLDALYPKTASDWAQRHWLHVRTIFGDDEIARLTGNSTFQPSRFFRENRWIRFGDRDPLTASFEFDVNYYLPDDLLKKVDMASMCSSLETRAPFLDHRVVEYSFAIDPLMKVEDDVLKHVLKRALVPHLPQQVLHRAKTGFGAPVSSWLSGPLKDESQDLLSTGCRVEGVLGRDEVDRIRAAGSRTRPEDDYRIAYRLWLLFVLERWMRAYARS